MHVAMEDPSVRTNGFVLIAYLKNCAFDQIHRDLIAKGIFILGNVIPLQWKSFHVCHPCSFYNTFSPFIKLMVPKQMKGNILVHFGAEDHVLQCMASHSIPTERLPSDFGGGEVLDYTKWLSERKTFEEGVTCGSDVLSRETTMLNSNHEMLGDTLQWESVRPKTKSSETLGSTARSPQPSLSGEIYAFKQITIAPTIITLIHHSNLTFLKCHFRVEGSSSLSPEESYNLPESPTPCEPLSRLSNCETNPPVGGKIRRPGRKGDARMHRAVIVKLENSELSLVEALQEGGFLFDRLNEKGKPHHEVFDQDGVSLMQRKNQLLRRVRVEKKKRDEG